MIVAPSCAYALPHLAFGAPCSMPADRRRAGAVAGWPWARRARESPFQRRRAAEFISDSRMLISADVGNGADEIVMRPLAPSTLPPSRSRRTARPRAGMACRWRGLPPRQGASRPRPLLPGRFMKPGWPVSIEGGIGCSAILASRPGPVPRRLMALRRSPAGAVARKPHARRARWLAVWRGAVSAWAPVASCHQERKHEPPPGTRASSSTMASMTGAARRDAMTRLPPACRTFRWRASARACARPGGLHSSPLARAAGGLRSDRSSKRPRRRRRRASGRRRRRRGPRASDAAARRRGRSAIAAIAADAWAGLLPFPASRPSDDGWRSPAHQPLAAHSGLQHQGLPQHRWLRRSALIEAAALDVCARRSEAALDPRIASHARRRGGNRRCRGIASAHRRFTVGFPGRYR